MNFKKRRNNMAIVVLICGALFFALAVSTIFRPELIVRLVNRADIKWSMDKELFMSSQTIRISIGILFAFAAAVLFYATYSIVR